MGSQPAQPLSISSPFEQLRYAREIVALEGQALTGLAARLDTTFCDAAAYVRDCRGSVIVTGVGKAGLIAQKIAATLASTGTRAHFLHAAEAVHGDLGRIADEDVVLVLSQSGETEEIVRLLPSLRRIDVPLIAITASQNNSLGRAATVTLELGSLQEACSLGLAPSTSTTAMLALGDALALVVSRLHHFQPADFAQFHPGGSLGLRLSTVDQLMRPISHCRVTRDSESVRQTFVKLSRPGRRSGAIMLVDDDGCLTGVFTDSDLARLFEARRDDAFDQPMRGVMTPNPTAVRAGSPTTEAVHRMAERKFSELPVVDEHRRPVGMIDVTDVVALMPDDDEPARTAGIIPADGTPYPAPARTAPGPPSVHEN